MAYAEELATSEGRRYLRELVAGSAEQGYAGRCGEDTRDVFRLLVSRAITRGEIAPKELTEQSFLERIAAPIIYSILFDRTAVDGDAVRRLVDQYLIDSLI